MGKIYYIHKEKNDRHHIIKGTLEELIVRFSYTLEIGHSYNARINTHPKTIKSFITSLQNAFREREACCYNRTFVNIATEEEIEKYKEGE